MLQRCSFSQADASCLREQLFPHVCWLKCRNQSKGQFQNSNQVPDRLFLQLGTLRVGLLLDSMAFYWPGEKNKEGPLCSRPKGESLCFVCRSKHVVWQDSLLLCSADFNLQWGHLAARGLRVGFRQWSKQSVAFPCNGHIYFWFLGRHQPIPGRRVGINFHLSLMLGRYGEAACKAPFP